MGLDMYLEAEEYISGYQHNGQEAQRFKEIAQATGLIDIVAEDTPSMKVSIVAVYWRRANQIHA